MNEKHANTAIPKFLGAMNRYVTTNGKTIDGQVVDASEYLEYAEKFFDMVLERHTYITGDNSEWEHFGADNILDGERTSCNCETCNAYNMMKLAKGLYMITGDTKYSDYYETAFYNTILSSQNPETGMTTYFQPMATGYFKVYSTEETNFWCCTGSGMENFTKLSNAIYYHNNDMIVVNQYLSSELEDTDKNVKITQTADIPASDTVTFTLDTLDGTENIGTDLGFRLPEWLAGDAVVKVNDVAVDAKEDAGYAVVSGLKNHDTVSITLPMEIRAYNLPDNQSVYGFKYGPIVLSAKLGTKNMSSSTTGVNVTIPSAKVIEEDYTGEGTETISVISGSVSDYIANINENLVKKDGKLEWTLENTDANLTFVPHYSQHTERYGIYFEYISNSSAFNGKKYVAEKAKELFEKSLIDTVQPGYGQYENDILHDMKENNSIGQVSDGTSRYAQAGGFFTYTMLVNETGDHSLQVTFRKADNGKTIKISVGDTVVYEKTLDYDGSEEEYTVRIPVYQEVIEAAMYAKQYTSGGESVTGNVVDVKFESADNNDSAAIYGFLYMTEAYSDDASLNLSASAGKLTQEGTAYTLSLEKDVTAVDLTTKLASPYAYLQINGSIVKETELYHVDMSRNNYVSLNFRVYAEDHETYKDYTLSIVKDADLAARPNTDKKLAYFVDCGDYDVTTLSEGDLFGLYNGVTEQAYGKDPVTGYSWGVVDTLSVPLTNGMADNAYMTNAVFTDHTWAFETNNSLRDGSQKTDTNRYTKNQWETGIDRNLNYQFELPNGAYTVELYFADPWGVSKNPIVSANGEKLMENVAVGKAVTSEVDVTDGMLKLNITSPEETKCLNLSYIKIYMPDEEVNGSDDKNQDSDDKNTSDNTNDKKNEDGKGENKVIDDTVKTGDSSHFFKLILMMLASAGVCGIVYTKKRKTVKAEEQKDN